MTVRVSGVANCNLNRCDTDYSSALYSLTWWWVHCAIKDWAWEFEYTNWTLQGWQVSIPIPRTPKQTNKEVCWMWTVCLDIPMSITLWIWQCIIAYIETDAIENYDYKCWENATQFGTNLWWVQVINISDKWNYPYSVSLRENVAWTITDVRDFLTPTKTVILKEIQDVIDWLQTQISTNTTCIEEAKEDIAFLQTQLPSPCDYPCVWTVNDWDTLMTGWIVIDVITPESFDWQLFLLNNIWSTSSALPYTSTTDVKMVSMTFNLVTLWFWWFPVCLQADTSTWSYTSNTVTPSNWNPVTFTFPSWQCPTYWAWETFNIYLVHKPNASSPNATVLLQWWTVSWSSTWNTNLQQWDFSDKWDETFIWFALWSKSWWTVQVQESWIVDTYNWTIWPAWSTVYMWENWQVTSVPNDCPVWKSICWGTKILL